MASAASLLAIALAWPAPTRDPLRSRAIDACRALAERLRADVAYILGGAVARRIGAGFIPVRKPGKLPWDTHSAEYVLEYGVDALEIHKDAVSHGTRVLVHDDLLATGGTARALCDLVELLGAHVVGCAFLVELTFLPGRSKLAPHEVISLVQYESE